MRSLVRSQLSPPHIKNRGFNPDFLLFAALTAILFITSRLCEEQHSRAEQPLRFTELFYFFPLGIALTEGVYKSLDTLPDALCKARLLSAYTRDRFTVTEQIFNAISNHLL